MKLCAREKAKSLAMSALGCGLGGLSLAEVTPILLVAEKQMADLGVLVSLYLPETK